MTMPLSPTTLDIAVRLVLTIVAAALVGLNREARGHAAGFRTTILVALAACVSMIQANLLLPLGGKASDSFAVMDLMRLPLGILTGVGFIGGGAILRRGDFVTGVTTAATLWMMTVVGLCFGGGQLGLGAAATVLAVVTLYALKSVDVRIPREHRAMLEIAAGTGAVIEIVKLTSPYGFRLRLVGQSRAGDRLLQKFEVRWTRAEIAGPPMDLLQLVGDKYPIESFGIIEEGGH